MMPGMDGLEMCRKIRETNNIPIIMLSAKSTDLDKILGLGTGADDYVVKPLSVRQICDAYFYFGFFGFILYLGFDGAYLV